MRLQIVDAARLQRQHLNVGRRRCREVVLGLLPQPVKIHDLSANVFQLERLQPPLLLLQHVLHKPHS